MLHKNQPSKRELSFVRLLGAPWEALWQRPQQMMVQLSKRHKVLYVNPPSRRPSRRPLDRTSQNLWVLRPLSLTYLLGPSLQDFEDWCLAVLVKLVARLIGLSTLVVWHSEYSSCRFIGLLDERWNLYDCCDDFVTVAEDSEAAFWEESKMLARADAVIVTSDRLLQKKQLKSQRTCLVPNAADIENLRPERTSPCPPDLATIPKPRIAFVGAFDTWVDTNLIKEIARSRPDWSFVVIGPVNQISRTLAGVENVHFLGRKQFRELPAYYSHIDVGIVPFMISDFTHCVDPIKVYEYLAMEKPVVATKIQEMGKFGSFVLTAGSADEFRVRIVEALRSDSDFHMIRSAWAEANSWGERAGRVEKLISQMEREREQQSQTSSSGTDEVEL